MIAIGLLLTISIATVDCVNCRPYIYVDDDNINGPWDGTLEHPYQYIRDGINASENGDTVFVFSGTYYEGRLQYRGKSIKLIGEDKETTIIDGDIVTRFEFYDVEHVTVSGFSLKNASGITLGDCNYSTISNNILIGRYCAIHLSQSSYNSIEENIIKGNHCEAIDLTFDSNGNTISGNYITHCERSINIQFDSSNNIIKENLIVDSYDEFGATGIELFDAFDNVIMDNTLNNITGSLGGHGVRLFASSGNIIENNDITNISGGLGSYGISLTHSPDNTIAANTIANISGGINSEGIALGFSEESTVKENIIINCNDGIVLSASSNHSVINENTIEDCSRYGVSLRDTNYTDITYNIFKGNNVDATFLFAHILEEGESYIPGTIPDSYNRDEQDLSNYWNRNYWNNPLYHPKTIYGTLEVYKYVGEILVKIIPDVTLINKDMDPLLVSYVVSQSYSQIISESNSQQSITSSSSSEILEGIIQ